MQSCVAPQKRADALCVLLPDGCHARLQLPPCLGDRARYRGIHASIAQLLLHGAPRRDQCGVLLQQLLLLLLLLLLPCCSSNGQRLSS